MRKALGIVMMLMVVSVFLLTIRGDRTALEDTQLDYDANKEITTLQQQFEAGYPQTPKEVVAYYNDVLAIQYHAAMPEKAIPETITLARNVYSKALSNLNDHSAQVAQFQKEYVRNQKENNYYQAGTIKEIAFEEDMLAYVDVDYELTEAGFQRTYELVFEDEKWRINKWQDKMPNK